MQACSITRMPAVQESDFMTRRLWHGPICVLGLANRPVNTKSGEDLKGFVSPSPMRCMQDLTFSQASGKEVIDEWYNAVQAQVNLAKYPTETAKILHRDIFWFFLWDEEFVSRTISDGTEDLHKFPASRV